MGNAAGKQEMRVGLFNPYLDSLGGGEKYTLTLAEHLSNQGHQVHLFWNEREVRKKLEERFNLNLKKISFVENIFSSNNNFLQKWQITRKYDLIFYLSDGSLPFLFAKKNILHFQVPFKGVSGKSFLNRLKLVNFHHVVCNSEFTKKHIDLEFGIKSQIVYPPVAVNNFKPGKKGNLILSVGRFTQALHAKKQQILIEVFRKMCDQGLKDWHLVLAGGALEEDKGYLEALKNSAGEYPIKIETNLKFGALKDYYGQAKIYWHAAGFGEDENLYPERLEHFGISVVEAMASGGVPVVINKGGIPEIVTHGVNGLLWETKSDLIKSTLRLTKSQALWEKLSHQAVKDSQKFSQKVFCQKFDEIIKN
jgi:glycosyltransferase involved in cell wall biosynthesis